MLISLGKFLSPSVIAQRFRTSGGRKFFNLNLAHQAHETLADTPSALDLPVETAAERPEGVH